MKVKSKEKITGKLWEDIRKLKTREGYLLAGHPNYHKLFGRDSLISAWQMLGVDNDCSNATLETLARHQGKKVDSKSEEEPGKIIHEVKGRLKKWKYPYYGSVDSTPLFVIVLAEYYRTTRDEKFVEKIWPNVERALGWLESHTDENGFLVYGRMNPSGLFHQGWKDGFDDHLRIEPPVAIVEAQGYLYRALMDTMQLSHVVRKDKSMKKHLGKMAETLRRNFNKKFWMANENYFCLGLDGTKRQARRVASNPGHLLFTGIVGKRRARSIRDRLFEGDMWTPYGIRTLSTKDHLFDPASYHNGSVWPHDNWMIWRGLMEMGFERDAGRVKSALLSAFQKLEHMPELYCVEPRSQKLKEITSISQIGGRKANPVQAWASAGLLRMLMSD